jgi:hypothetical protein
MFKISYDEVNEKFTTSLKDLPTDEQVNVDVDLADVPTAQIAFSKLMAAIQIALKATLDLKIAANVKTVNQRLVDKVNQVINTDITETPSNALINAVKAEVY